MSKYIVVGAGFTPFSPVNNDIEKWLLSRGFFFENCQKCAKRKVGCTKDCKFYQNYRRGKKK